MAGRLDAGSRELGDLADLHGLHGTHLSHGDILHSGVYYRVKGQRIQESTGVASESLAGRIRDALARKQNIEQKKMFGGVGLLLKGNMLVGIWMTSLIVRLGPDSYDDALLEPHVREFDITGKAMKGWVTVEPEGVEDDVHLTDWIERAMKFVKTLPKK